VRFTETISSAKPVGIPDRELLGKVGIIAQVGLVRGIMKIEQSFRFIRPLTLAVAFRAPETAGE
jgi:hypothetical protein